MILDKKAIEFLKIDAEDKLKDSKLPILFKGDCVSRLSLIETLEDIEGSRDFYKNALEELKRIMEQGEIIDFPFKLGEKVYYLTTEWGKKFTIAEGNILGFSVRQGEKEVVKCVDFKAKNGVPIEYVCRTKEEVAKVAEQLRLNIL